MHALRPFRAFCLLGGILVASLAPAQEASKPPEPPPQNASSEEFAKYAMKLREAALASVEPRTLLPTAERPKFQGAYQWRQDIVTTLFSVGRENPSSCWDPKWAEHFGGNDNSDPSTRLAADNDYRPRAFVPQLNPFYFALPYNDVEKNGTKAESRTCIPWFRIVFMEEGTSVLRDRWIAIRNRKNGRIAYAQWSDCGPFKTDHWQYVFGNERPRANQNEGAGLNVSPAVRDYLALERTAVTDWRFVEAREVPPGPWRRYGENNPFVQQARLKASPNAKAPASPPPAPPEPTVRADR